MRFFLRPCAIFAEKKMDSYEQVCLCALNGIFGFAPRKGYQLYRYAGSAAAVFAMDPQELRDCLGPGVLASRVGPAALEAAERELESFSGSSCRFLGIDDPAYPALLREIDDPPLGLYLRSETPPEALFPPDRTPIGVVGTRKITPYGAEWCRRIVAGIAAAPGKSVIVSGLAFGADIIAHRTALDNGVPTIAVMATGIDEVYPRQHLESARRMVSTPGCALLTDYPPHSQPEAATFVRRNRIIAGLSRAVILIESRIKGGGMITAGYAGDYDRDLFALPGRADDDCSQGCNRLIRDQRAEAITDIPDLVHRLGLGSLLRRKKEDLREEARRCLARQLPAAEAETAADLLLAVRAYRGITVDQLCERSGLPYPLVSEYVRRLETEGFLSVDLLQRCCVNAKKL